MKEACTKRRKLKERILPPHSQDPHGPPRTPQGQQRSYIKEYRRNNIKREVLHDHPVIGLHGGLSLLTVD